VGRLEASGLMREMTDRLRTDSGLAERHRAAHEAYLQRREELGQVPEIAGVSAGGMPTRVKCLHVLVAHALAAGPGVNPLGDEALALLPPWWEQGRCVEPAGSSDAGSVGTGPIGTGPFGPELAGPEAVGPELAGPESVGPESVGPETVGRESAGPGSVDPRRAAAR
jgi:hypothetical protein